MTPDQHQYAYTAMCLWECVLEQINDLEMFADYRDSHGTASLRDTVCGWAPLVEQDWAQARDTYDEAFDWEFVPAWVRLNISYGLDVRPDRLIPEA